MKTRKAQAWGFDLIAAMMIFLVGIILFFFYVLNAPNENNDVFNNFDYEGKIVGDSLFSSGFPEDWDQSDVVTIGIMSNGALNETKLEEFYDFVNSDYERTKRLFNILNEYYVYFEEPIVVDSVSIEGIGWKESNPKNLVKITRVMVHN